MVEAVTWSIHPETGRRLFGGGQAELVLANPIASDLSDKRPVAGLVAAQANINRGYPDVALFEVGQIFRGDKPEDQLVAASGVRPVCVVERHRAALVRLGNGRMRSTPRRMRSRCWRPPSADAGAADRARRSRLAASRTIRDHQIGPQNVLGRLANCIRAPWGASAPTAR